MTGLPVRCVAGGAVVASPAPDIVMGVSRAGVGGEELDAPNDAVAAVDVVKEDLALDEQAAAVTARTSTATGPTWDSRSLWWRSAGSRAGPVAAAGSPPPAEW